MSYLRYCLLLLLLGSRPLPSQPLGGEAAFQARGRGLLPAIAALGYGERGLAPSRCPDTGLPVYTYALQGETIYSPYTGRAYLQGPTGYFGPRARNAQGQITAFGGDAMKYDLPPATAALLLDPSDARARHLLTIPGYLHQQFFFPAVNWTRFYGLAGHLMPPAWHDSLRAAVAQYINTHHYDASGQSIIGTLSYPHSLVGQPGQVLGGNPQDGGTENHKTMWRTAGLLYAQWFGDSARISQVPAPQAAALIDTMLRDYLRRCLTTGNGEYLSSIYYPYALMGYLNLYDFSPDSATRLLARATLDYYLATYALCALDGVVAGPQRRGYLSYGPPNDMERYLWLWSGAGPWAFDSSRLASKVMLHPYTSTYRPHPLIHKLLTKQIPLPYEAWIAHPSYYLDQANEHPAYMYMSQSFALGSTPIPQIDNPSQQVCWSLVLRDDTRPLQLGGGHPRYPFPSGHSPYSQTLQKDGALLLLTGQHDPVAPPDDLRADRRSWYHNTDVQLQPTRWPAAGASATAWIDFLAQAPQRAETWLYLPRGYHDRLEIGGNLYLAYDQTFLAVTPAGQGRWLDLPPLDSLQQWLRAEKGRQKVFDHYEIWVISGAFSGFALEAAEAADYGGLAAFAAAHQARAHLDRRALARGRLRYRSLGGHDLRLQFESQAMWPTAQIDGTPVRYDRWARGGVYDSPLLQVRDGYLRLTDGETTYEIRMDAALRLTTLGD